MSAEYFWIWIFNIIKKIILFIFIYTLVLVFFYILGTIQKFTAISHYMLLFLLESATLVNAILCLYCWIYYFSRWFIEKRLRLKSFLIFIGGFMLNISLFLFLKFVLSWLEAI